ncbi:MAG: hypothetical protein GF308_04150, partial [Candidatus Heimdallarchaeota archaeon]|nr:hypothetical protein [Candidatus Heimdallarchaeota archaeon]
MVSRTFKRLKIQMETPLATPGNGAVSGGKINNLLLLGTGDGTKYGKRYLVKGLRGLINHSMMALAEQRGIEICHSSQKTETKEEESLLPEGFHPNGECYPENECIRHKIMGSIKKQSKLRFKPVVVVSAKAKGEQEGAQKVHIATNRHNTLVHKSKRAIQDYGERYISGAFTLIIELLEELSKEELGFLVQAILHSSEMGFGAKANDGSGELEVLEIVLQEVTRTRTIGAKGKVVKEEKERNLWKEL